MLLYAVVERVTGVLEKLAYSFTTGPSGVGWREGGLSIAMRMWESILHAAGCYAITGLCVSPHHFPPSPPRHSPTIVRVPSLAAIAAQHLIVIPVRARVCVRVCMCLFLGMFGQGIEPVVVCTHVI